MFAFVRNGWRWVPERRPKVELPRSWADEVQERLDRARQRQFPGPPRGALDAAALESLQREMARQLYRARRKARLSQEQVAAYMGTTKSVVCRLETHSAHMPSTATLLRYARAVGCTVEVRLVPYVEPPPPPEVDILDLVDWDELNRR